MRIVVKGINVTESSKIDELAAFFLITNTIATDTKLFLHIKLKSTGNIERVVPCCFSLIVKYERKINSMLNVTEREQGKLVDIVRIW